MRTASSSRVTPRAVHSPVIGAAANWRHEALRGQVIDFLRRGLLDEQR